MKQALFLTIRAGLGLGYEPWKAVQELSWVLLAWEQRECCLEKCNAQHFWNFSFWIKFTAVCKTSWNILGFDTLGFYGELKRARLKQCVGQVDTLRASVCRSTPLLRTKTIITWIWPNRYCTVLTFCKINSLPDWDLVCQASDWSSFYGWVINPWKKRFVTWMLTQLKL